jgi:hypothetical protein
MDKSKKIYSLEEIKKIIHQNEKDLKEKYKTLRFYIFGSYSRGEQTEESDIDFLVEFSEPVDMFEFVNLQDYLKEIFGKNIDLGTPKGLKSFIRDKILKEAVIL